MTGTEPQIGILCLDEPPYEMPERGGLYDQSLFPWKILRQTVPGATIAAILSADPKLLEPYIDTAKTLEECGAGILISNCGYTIAYDSMIRRTVSVPVATSSLLLLPLLAGLLRAGEKIGVLTFDAEKLTLEHLRAAWPTIVVEAIQLSGLEHTRSWEQVVSVGYYDWPQLEADSLNALDRLLKEAPNVKFIVVECCALCSYTSIYKERSRVPVFDIVSLTNFLIGAPSNEKRPEARLDGQT